MVGLVIAVPALASSTAPAYLPRMVTCQSSTHTSATTMGLDASEQALRPVAYPTARAILHGLGMLPNSAEESGLSLTFGEAPGGGRYDLE
jgi:hypothetical protein